MVSERDYQGGGMEPRTVQEILKAHLDLNWKDLNLLFLEYLRAFFSAILSLSSFFLLGNIIHHFLMKKNCLLKKCLGFKVYKSYFPFTKV